MQDQQEGLDAQLQRAHARKDELNKQVQALEASKAELQQDHGEQVQAVKTLQEGKQAVDNRLAEAVKQVSALNARLVEVQKEHGAPHKHAPTCASLYAPPKPPDDIFIGPRCLGCSNSSSVVLVHGHLCKRHWAQPILCCILMPWCILLQHGILSTDNAGTAGAQCQELKTQMSMEQQSKEDLKVRCCPYPALFICRVHAHHPSTVTALNNLGFRYPLLTS